MKKAGKRTNTKHRILQSACTLLEREGMDAVSVRRVAKSVDITPMGIYNHFPNREALLVAVYERGVQKLARSVWKGMARAESPPEKLQSLVSAYVGFGTRNPNYYMLLFGSTFIQKYSWESPPRSLIMENFWMPLTEVIEACLESGLIKLDANPQELATHLWAAMHGYVSFFLLGRLQQLWQMDEEAIMQAMTKHLLPFLNTYTE